MPDPQPPYLADELARFRATVDAAVERGRRAADDARAAGAAFHRETEALARAASAGTPRPAASEPTAPEPTAPEPTSARPTAPELRAAATEFRTANGLPVPDLDAPGAPPAGAPRRPAPPEDEDFSQFRIMRPL